MPPKSLAALSAAAPGTRASAVCAAVLVPAVVAVGGAGATPDPGVRLFRIMLPSATWFVGPGVPTVPVIGVVSGRSSSSSSSTPGRTTPRSVSRWRTPCGSTGT